MNKFILLVILISMILAGCNNKELTTGKHSTNENNVIAKQADTVIEPTIEPTPESKKQLTEQEIAIRKSEVKSKFIEKFGIDSSTVAEPLMYDITNDGVEDIVLNTKKQFDDGLSNYYIGIYSLQDGTQLFAEQYEAADELLITPISNPTYHNVLAAIDIYAGGSAIHYSAKVLAVNKNEVQTIFNSADLETGDPESIVVDIDNDGFQEFQGMEYDYGPGSDRLSRADGTIDDVVYLWNAATKAYEAAIIGEDGITDEQRNSTGELTKDKALQIVKVAQEVQYNWVDVLPYEDVRKLLRPFFSNNFIKEYIEAGSSSDYGYEQEYYMTGMQTWMIPVYTDEAKFELSSDGIYASLNQEIALDTEEGTFTVHASTTLVKTKYGWKIDKLEKEARG